MPLTTVIITIVAAGLLLWIVNRFIPMQSQIKSILNGVVAIVLVAGGNQARGHSDPCQRTAHIPCPQRWWWTCRPR